LARKAKSPAKRAAKRPAVKAPRAKAPAKKAAAKKKSPAKKASRKPAAKPPSSKKSQGIDLGAFPPESISAIEKRLCLACVLDIFTRHLGLAARTANLEIRKYTPSLAELYGPDTARPWFADPGKQHPCPYCGSAAKWHTTLPVYRIESGKATDARRRELIQSLPSDDRFAVLEERATQQQAFFEWLEKVSTGLDLDDPVWLLEVSRHYLSRREPKTDWHEIFAQIRSIRRSRRLESGWEIDAGRLFLAPHLFDELLLVQYLVSRSHRAGGLTLEGRYTLPELFLRLRNSGYLRAAGITAHNAADALEELVTRLGGGEAGIKFYHVLDRREFLEKVKSLRLSKPPKPKTGSNRV
jgi:hypothetical protein